MGEKQQTAGHEDRHVKAYERMLERVRDFLGEAGHELEPRLEAAIAKAKETAAALGELTREEAERIGDYLRRDLEDAGRYLAEQGGELADWLRFDLQLVEAQLAQWLAQAADQTRLEWERLALRARAVGQWRTGEITGPGTLVCTTCGETLHFHRAGRIPPCPKCKGSTFRRGD